MGSIFSIIIGILMVLGIALIGLVCLALVVGAIVGIIYLVKKNNKKAELTETKESDKE